MWLDKFDDLLKSAVSGITNNVLSDSHWRQATLPIKDGDLGIRRVASLARQFLPVWLQRQALSSCRTTSLPLLTSASTLKFRWEATYGPAPFVQLCAWQGLCLQSYDSDCHHLMYSWPRSHDGYVKVIPC